LIVAILLSTFLFTWLKKTYDENDETWSYNIGPTFISVNGTWYFFARIFDCDAKHFGHKFCNSSIDVGIASIVYNFGAFITVIVYIVSLIFPYKVNLFPFKFIEL
jgi:hypothetical protein